MKLRFLLLSSSEKPIFSGRKTEQKMKPTPKFGVNIIYFTINYYHPNSKFPSFFLPTFLETFQK
jgi:hypothetical protein